MAYRKLQLNFSHILGFLCFSRYVVSGIQVKFSTDFSQNFLRPFHGACCKMYPLYTGLWEGVNTYRSKNSLAKLMLMTSPHVGVHALRLLGSLLIMSS